MPHVSQGSPATLFGALALVLVAARLGAALCRRLRVPEVLGELLIGIVIGNLGLLGLRAFDALRSDPGLDLLGQIGVLFLLFVVGLELDLGQMLRVGASSFLVAVVGVVAPMTLGFLVSRLFHPAEPAALHVFVGATLCATSVGIAARVLADLGKSDGETGRIILGAAVIDDVLGLVVLAVVVGMISAGGRALGLDLVAIGFLVLRAAAFLVGAIVLGRWVARHTFQLAGRLEGEGLLLSFSLAFLFSLAWIADLAGLAPIVGAFAAGLVLEEARYRALRDRDPRHRSLRELLEPLATFLVPVFFVLMGMRVDLAAFAGRGVPLFALALTAAAVLGKLAAGLGVLGRGADRVAVAIGMIPRGEVGLIFAGAGAGLMIEGRRVIDAPAYAAIVVMVALTTLIAPPLLARRLRQGRP